MQRVGGIGTAICKVMVPGLEFSATELGRVLFLSGCESLRG